MSQMVQHVPDAGSYAPVTILIDQRPDGVYLSYDRMATFLAPYGEFRGYESGSRSGGEAVLLSHV